VDGPVSNIRRKAIIPFNVPPVYTMLINEKGIYLRWYGIVHTTAICIIRLVCTRISIADNDPTMIRFAIWRAAGIIVIP